MTETIKQVDTLIAESFQLEKTGTKEEVLSFAGRSNKFTMSALNDLKSFRDLYDISTYSQFETNIFFPADSFSIPPEKIEEAKKAIEPMAQRIVRFLADHPYQKFDAVIACSCTTDNQELNGVLCEARARSVVNLLADQIRSKNDFIPKPEWIRYNIKWVSQPEAIPYPGKRRSMVSITWNLLPASLYVGQKGL